MGRLSDNQLRQPRPSVWAPRPVGVLLLDGNTSATLLREEKPHLWEYGSEIPIKVNLIAFESIALPGTREYLFWSGIEVRIRRDDLPYLGPGDQGYHVTAALRPRSFLWYASAPLRPSLNKGKVPQWRNLMKSLADGRLHISALPFDPFERSPDWLVARLGDPMRPHWQDEGAQDVDGARVVYNRRGRPRREKADDKTFSSDHLRPREWFFGLCPKSPDRVAISLESTCGDFLADALNEKFPLRASPRGQRSGRRVRRTLPDADDALEFKDKSQMGIASGLPAPSAARAQGILRDAVYMALGGRSQGSQIPLRFQAWRDFRNLYRDDAQRLGSRAQGFDFEFADRVYAEFILKHQECDLFRHRGCVDLELIGTVSRSPEGDPKLAKCARLFAEFIKSR